MDTIAQGQGNHLAPIVVGLIRALSLEREAHECTKEVLHEAVAMIGEQDRKLDRERANRLDLLAQYRTLLEGLAHDGDQLTGERRQAA